MRLGEFGAAQRELIGAKDDFVFCGQVFDVEQSIPAVLMLQLGASATGKIEETEGFAAIWEALRISLTKPAPKGADGEPVKNDDDEVIEADATPFNRFYKLAVDDGCEMETLMRLVFALFEAQGGRPTQQASGSSGGPTPISPSSNISSTPKVPSHLRSVDSLIRGDSETIQGVDSNVVRMGDGQLVSVEYGTPPTEQIG